jgi:hypothetical protein
MNHGRNQGFSLAWEAENGKKRKRRIFMLTFFVFLVLSGNDRQIFPPEAVGNVLTKAAQMGVPRQYIKCAFGEPDFDVELRLDGRRNMDIHVLWEYSRYGVWISWDGNGATAIGRSPAVRKISGGVFP